MWELPIQLLVSVYWFWIVCFSYLAVMVSVQIWLNRYLWWIKGDMTHWQNNLEKYYTLYCRCSVRSNKSIVLLICRTQSICSDDFYRVFINMYRNVRPKHSSRKVNFNRKLAKLECYMLSCNQQLRDQLTSVAYVTAKGIAITSWRISPCLS